MDFVREKKRKQWVKQIQRDASHVIGQDYSFLDHCNTPEDKNPFRFTSSHCTLFSIPW